MTPEIESNNKKNRLTSGDHAEQIQREIRTSLNTNSYFAPRCQIDVSITPERAIRLSGCVENFFLRQQAILSALCHINPEQLEDRIEVISFSTRKNQEEIND